MTISYDRDKFRELDGTGRLYHTDGEKKGGFSLQVAHLVRGRLWFVSERDGKPSVGWYDYGDCTGDVNSFHGIIKPHEGTAVVVGVRLASDEARKIQGGKQSDVIASRRTELENIWQTVKV